MSHRLLPHTADLRAALDAATLEELYASGVDLVRETLVGESLVTPRDERRLAVEHPDEAERFFRFVRDLLYLYDAEGFIASALRSVQPLTVAGEHFDPARHQSHHQVKAVTRHGYTFERRSDGTCHAELVLDL